jgi:ATP/maltotriose-dependent transcriptional regulator MalT
MRDLFLRRLDENGDWFRYQDLFAEFLRRRLDRDHPELTTPLHRTASEWFAKHHRLVEAVDHALAAGDAPRAVELVETDGPGLLEHSQMSTLLGLVEKLPSDAVVSSLTLQMMLSWAYVLLGRTSLARAALERVDGVLEAMQGAGADVADLRAEARVVEAVVRGMADRTDGIDDLVGECLSRPDTLLPFVVSVAVNAATFAAIARFDFDAAHRWQTWASPYHQQNSGPYTVMYGYALDGIAAFEQLDLARAEGCFRAARQVACKSGAAHGQGARLAGALLAELLYERGGIDEAERLLAESFKLGAEEGIVDMINARFVVGARLAVLRGDRGAAAEHLDQAADIAERLSRPRLLASVQNERVILGLPTRRVVRPPVDFAQRRRPVDGVDEMTAQLEEETAIRLIINESRDEADAACRWAQEWVDRLKGRGRHRASLRAERLLAECLLVVGRAAEAKQLFGAVLARCADLGMVRFPLDGGEQLLSLIAEIRNDHQTGRSESATPQVPMSYLDRLLGAAGRTTTG